MVYRYVITSWFIKHTLSRSGQSPMPAISTDVVAY